MYNTDSNALSAEKVISLALKLLPVKIYCILKQYCSGLLVSCQKFIKTGSDSKKIVKIFEDKSQMCLGRIARHDLTQYQNEWRH